ncbi:MAG: rod shape-determining protein MreD [Proteobacteria bacterium]|nr:rod shape-determining protein MreD [Pseudomonadota bacterium]MDA0914037.1 rod shape-determining protein MreD [Pseudomonadota bacterium]MDA1033077.1 rod shape-determining protein MreD [Pseudomonadota bacterium]
MPLLPPMGFLLLVGWRLMRPGTLPAWIGFPLGAIDDLVSGQPFGSAILLWSVTLLAFEWFESRFPWRGFFQDWLASAIACSSYVLAAALLSGAVFSLPILVAITLQLLLSMALYPIIAAMVVTLDSIRLLRIREIR